jgi:outer membrane immunogenic protein
MMKMLLGLAAAVAVSSTALAADMPRKAQQLVQEPTYVQIWTGVYFGGQAGWANIDTDPSFLKSAASGVTYGGHIGFMKQLGSFVFGVEGGVDDFSNVKTNGKGCDCIVADVVAKIGFTPTPNTLVYALGGGFWHNANIIGIPNFGWEVGGGAAWKPFDNHWTVSVEYKYRDLDLKQTAPINVFSHGVQGKLAYQF